MMSDSVVDHIAQHFGIQPDQAEDLLRTLAEHIRNQVNQDERVHIPGLGVFTSTDDGLSFEPEPALEEDLGGQYSGLDPVTLTPAGDDAASERGQETTAQSLRTDRRRRRQPPKARRSPAGRIALVTVTILVVIAGAYAYSEGLLFGPAATSSEDPAQTPLTRLVPADSIGPQPVQAQDTLRVTEEEPAAAETAAGIDRAMGGYTLVVGSYLSRAAAQQMVESIRDRPEGVAWPLDIMPHELSGTWWFRVVIGQTPTMEEARAIRNQVSGVPQNAWAVQIEAEG